MASEKKSGKFCWNYSAGYLSRHFDGKLSDDFNRQTYFKKELSLISVKKEERKNVLKWLSRLIIHRHFGRRRVIDFKRQTYFKEEWSGSEKKNGKNVNKVVGIKYKLILNKSEENEIELANGLEILK